MRFTGIPFWAVAALIAGAAGVLAVLHLLRVRPRRVRVVTILFWVHAVEPSRARVLLDRFRHPLTYALLLAICALMALALGRPQRDVASAERAHTVIVIDAGVAMSARGDDGRTRLDLAVQRVMAEVRGLRDADAVAVMAVDPEPRLVHRFETPRPLIARELSALAPAGLPGACDRAVRLAASLLQGRSRPEIVLITDRPFPPAPGLRVVQVGSPCGNAAIISAMFEPDEANPLRGRLLARVAAWGDGPRTVGLLVQRAGGAPLLNRSASIPAGTARDFVLADVPADGDRLVLRLSSGDALPADDEASFHLPLRNPIRVRMADGVPAGLRIALQSDPAVRLVEPGQRPDIDVCRDDSETADGRPCIVVEQTPSLPPGARVAVAADHPFFRGLDLEGAADVLPPGPGDESILIAFGDRVLARFRGDSAAPRLVLADALWSEDASFRRRAAFAVFLARAVRRLADWDADPVVLSPRRHGSDPLWVERAGLSGHRLIMPADRVSGDLTSTTADGEPAASSGPRLRPEPELFEALLAAALLLLVVEAFLHARGRIP